MKKIFFRLSYLYLTSVNHSQAKIKLSEIVDKDQISYLKPKKSESEWVSNVQRENRDKNLRFFKKIGLKLDPTNMNRIES
jgi:hypothetical protein